MDTQRTTIESQTNIPVQPTQTTPPPNQAIISRFPLTPGTTWVYIKTSYSQAEGESGRLIHSISRIEERVVDNQSVPPYTIVHIAGKKGMVSADDGWTENGTFGLGDYEYWYVIQEDKVYLSYQQPNPSAVQLEELPLAYAFPFSQGIGWCGTAQALRNAKNPTPLPNPPCFSRMVVKKSGPYDSPIGELGDCYEIHEVANSGDVITQFCNDTGIAAVRYDHGGTRFGFSQELVEWTNGEDGSSRMAQVPPFAALRITPTILSPIAASVTPAPSQ